ncbi:MAG: hypothetical protein ACT4OY_02690 [Alphaproteobacteria bacterium]
MFRKFSSLAVMGFSACILLAGCTTAKSTHDGSVASEDAALERAMRASGSRGGGNRSLSTLEKEYKRDSTDAFTATAYARGLRENDDLSRADLVLAPFANDAGSPAAAKTEFAAIQLAMGDNKAAQKYAAKALRQDPKNAKAYLYSGIALDAEGDHKQAEQSFRNALANWEGDPTPIMNNLALNLAAQEHLDEAIELLTKAKELAPDRIEVERNLRIVTALKQSASGVEPRPPSIPRR